MWQKCPVCDGSGMAPTKYVGSMSGICSTCNGHKIINEITGLPPARNTNATSALSNGCGDFRDGNMESQDEYFGRR